MTIYINPFAAGILATIIAELLCAFAYGAYLNWKEKKSETTEETDKRH